MEITKMRVNGVCNPLGYNLEPLSLSWNIEGTKEGEAPEAARIRIFERNGEGAGSEGTGGEGAGIEKSTGSTDTGKEGAPKEEEAGGKLKAEERQKTEGQKAAAQETEALKAEEKRKENKGQKDEGTLKCVYDTGWRKDLSSTGTEVKLHLEPETLYTWEVLVRGGRGSSAEKKAFFETGKMTDPWTGRWITGGDPDTPLVMRKKFTIRKREGSARLYILGLGVYEAYLNGEKVSREYLAPGYHSYDLHLQYQTYDVTELLRTGGNELKVYLGDGWYRGRLGFSGGYSNLYGERQILIAELYQAGDLLVKTDDTWQWQSSPVIFSNIYDGEIYAAGLVKENSWQSAEYAENPPKAPLTERYSLPVIMKDVFPVRKIIHTPKKETVLDFGQEVTGWVFFDIPGEENGGPKKGDAIRFTASEILQDGNFFRDNYRSARAEFTYICDGKKRRVRPHHTFYCFRYVKAEVIRHPVIQEEIIPAKNPPEGIPEKNRIKTVSGECRALTDKEVLDFSIAAVHLGSGFERTGYIETGDEEVNQLVSNVIWGQKDNFLDIPTDCPQRDERLGWTGDAQIFSKTACLNMDMSAFYRKYLWDMRAEQSLTDGAVANVVPRLKAGMVASCGISPWADAGVVIPWNAYEASGNVPLLREAYPGMKAWVDYARRKEEEKGGPHLNKDEFCFGDWLALDNPKPGPMGATDPQLIASAYYYQDADHTAKAAGILGCREEERTYKDLAEKILEAIREKFFDSEGLCKVKTQTAAALSVMFGLNPSKEALQKQGDILAELLQGNNDHLNTGFVGTPLLCPALSRTGHHDLAVSLLLNREYPGWLYCVRLGATTIWERWNSVEPDGKLNPEGMNSLNHYSYGSILGWMYQYIGGITAKEPGYTCADICPRPDKRLGRFDCAIDTAAGRYVSDWRYDGEGTVHYHVEIPSGGKAVVHVNGTVKELGPGTYDF